MDSRSFSQLSDDVLRRELSATAARERGERATLLAQIAEFDARKLFLEDGYSSMTEYCVRVLKMSEATAHKRIRATRVVRQFPEVLPALADGRITLTTLLQLSGHLEPGKAGELVDAVAGRSVFEVARVLAARKPSMDVPEQVAALGGGSQLAARRVDYQAPCRSADVTPLAEDRYAVTFSWGQSGHDKLQRATDLLSHDIPSRSMAAVLERALEVLIAQAEKRKFGATSRPRGRRTNNQKTRTIPAAVRRAVRERDGDQCTYVSSSGHRCQATARLEFDHIVPVARGGESSASNLRLRCRGHNQYEAEKTFGRGFMESKREQARAARTTASAPPPPEATPIPVAAMGGASQLAARRVDEPPDQDHVRDRCNPFVPSNHSWP